MCYIVLVAGLQAISLLDIYAQILEAHVGHKDIKR
jgi:hypothetical protein